jgi:hypothetical protein
MSRDLIQYPITQDEVAMHLAAAYSRAHSQGGIGDFTPHIFRTMANFVERMTPEEWEKLSEDLNP